VTSRAELPELSGAREAEDFFEALGVPFDPRVLAGHRLQVMKIFGLALEAWLTANPGGDVRARRAAAAGALREAHLAFADEAAPPAACRELFGAPLVRLGVRR
jgi:hypothetical protein